MRTSNSLDFVRHILKISATMSKSLGSHFFRTNTTIQSDTFEKSRLVITCLTNWRVTWTSYSFRVVLEGKVGKEILESSRLEFLEKFFANSLTLSKAEDNTSSVKYRRYSRFTFIENTISNLPKITRAKFLGSARLSYFIDISKFSSFKNPFTMITGLSKFCFRCRRFILLIQMKEVVSISYSSSTSSWEPWGWMRLDLVITMRDIYINSNLDPITKFSISSRNTKFTDTLQLNISQMIKKILSIIKRMAIKCVMKRGIPFDFERSINSTIIG